MAVQVWTFFLILCFKASYIIAQAPQLTPSGPIHSCENDALTFSCAASGNNGLYWELTGLSGVNVLPNFATTISQAFPRISTSDENRTVTPSNITILNLTRDDTGGTVQCEDLISQRRSTLSTITVGPPICNISITIEDVAVDSVVVSWVVSNCNILPTDYEVVWSEVGSEGQRNSSGRIANEPYRIKKLETCKNYTITVLLYNKCGVGSSSSTCACTNVGSLNITEAESCSLFPIGLHVDVTGGHIRCPVVQLLFSVNGNDLTYQYNPATVYDIVNGSAGEVYNYTVTAIYTETVTVSSDTALVTVSKGLDNVTIADAVEPDVIFNCFSSCQNLSSNYFCKINLDNDATEQGNFTENSATVTITITNLSSETTYYYNASIVFNNIEVDVLVNQSVTVIPKGTSASVGGGGVPPWIPVVIVIVILVIIAIVILLILLCYYMYKKYNKTHPKAERSNRENKPLKVSDALYAQTGPDTGGSHSGGGDPGLYSYAATETAFGAQVRKQEEASKVQPKKDTTDGASSPSHVAGPQGDLYAQPDKPTKGSRKEKDVKHVAAPATGDLYAMPEKGKPQVQHEKGPITGEEYAVAARKKDNLPILP